MPILYEQSSKILTLWQPYRRRMPRQAGWKALHIRFPKLMDSSISLIKIFCCSLLINKFTSLEIFATFIFCVKLAEESVWVSCMKPYTEYGGEGAQRKAKTTHWWLIAWLWNKNDHPNSFLFIEVLCLPGKY